MARLLRPGETTLPATQPTPGRARLLRPGETRGQVLEGEVLPPEEEQGQGGFGALPAAVSVAGLVGLAALLRRPGMLGKIGNVLQQGRMGLMLSGLAAPKSILGNVGAAVTEAGERGSMAPLREFFSPTTAREAWQGLRAGGNVEAFGQPTSGMNPFGRVMGSMDAATRNALVRAGLSEEEATRAVLQTPLTGQRFGSFAKTLNSPAAHYLFPFRRTPLNQLYEGLDVLKGEHPAMLAATTGLGAAHGAATADEPYPLSPVLGVALANRYGLPYALGALLGRNLGGGTGGGGISGAALPWSEYGIEQSMQEPVNILREPPALRALKRIRGY